MKRDWRERAFPVQVRIYSDASDKTKWALYSRHRDWGESARRAYVEAQNAHATCLVETVDIREPAPDAGSDGTAKKGGTE